MLQMETEIVRPQDERPARPDGTCFYCGRPIGAHHKDNCVIRQRTHVVDFTIRLVTREPASWGKESIEFRYNESSWCASNLLTDLRLWEEQNPDRCLCGQVSAVQVREATAEDEEEYGVYKWP